MLENTANDSGPPLSENLLHFLSYLTSDRGETGGNTESPSVRGHWLLARWLLVGTELLLFICLPCVCVFKN